jgi:hypothetical protein
LPKDFTRLFPEAIHRLSHVSEDEERHLASQWDEPWGERLGERETQ